MIELLLIPIAFFTSALAGALGMGGGILLIALMPGLLPPSAIIPVHALTQLASNSSRAVFGWRHLDWRIVPAFSAGALAGAWLGAELYAELDLQWLPALIGVVILFLTWLPLPQPRGGGHLGLVLLGFYQTGLGMLVGATGPLGAAVLLKRNAGRDWLVVNTALYMSLNHGFRIAFFGILGFAYADFWQLIGAMVIAVIAGSWVGTRIRQRIPQANFQLIFKLLVSVLALRMIGLVLYSAAG